MEQKQNFCPKKEKQPKRFGNLYGEICDLDNIRAAIMNASKNKRHQKAVRKVIENIDEYACKIQKMLLDESYVPSKYIMKSINDGIQQKRRDIAKPRFYPDQCIHHALIQVLEPCFMRGMYYYCCGSVSGRGDKRIRKAVIRFIVKRPKKAKYVLKMDVRHFYENIDHDELKQVLKRKIKDKKALRLCSLIIDSYPAGIPIGNYTSQWFCNVFLQDLDHEIKEFVGHDYLYVRYIDDMVIVGPNKRKLHKTRKMVEAELIRKKLDLKQNWQVFLLEKRPLDFVGVKFYKDGHTEIRKSILRRIKRKARRIGKMKDHVTVKSAAGMMSYMGRIHHTDSETLFRTEIQPYIVSTKRLRRIISDEAKLQRKTTGNVAGSAQ